MALLEVMLIIVQFNLGAMLLLAIFKHLLFDILLVVLQGGDGGQEVDAAPAKDGIVEDAAE